MKISLITFGLTEWSGGVDLIRRFASFISSDPMSQRSSFILPSRDCRYKAKNILYPLREIARQIFTGRTLKWIKRPQVSADTIDRLRTQFESSFDIFEGGSSLSTQIAAAHKCRSDVIFPCVVVPSKNKKQIPWIGYILDFQHLHYPQFFSMKELQLRDASFTKMLKEAKHIVTNSQDVINDIKKFCPGTLARLHPIPFSPCPEKEWLNSSLDVRKKYNITSEYFMISNQFWVHKDYETAFRAYEKYVSFGGKAKLVCTGATTDFRCPQHFQRLKNLLEDLGVANSVYILGHISKIDQIALLKKSLCIIQPTLFEGGPGGGSSYDAISMGIPVIASSIPINLEMDCGKLFFFNAGDPVDLSEKMKSLESISFIPATNIELWEIGNENKRKCRKFLFKVAQQCILDFEKK